MTLIVASIYLFMKLSPYLLEPTRPSGVSSQNCSRLFKNRDSPMTKYFFWGTSYHFFNSWKCCHWPTSRRLSLRRESGYRDWILRFHLAIPCSSHCITQLFPWSFLFFHHVLTLQLLSFWISCSKSVLHFLLFSTNLYQYFLLSFSFPILLVSSWLLLSPASSFPPQPVVSLIFSLFLSSSP
jgi:hypothetical protein